MREYKRVEDACVKLALAFLNESRIATVRVVGLESSRRQLLEFGGDLPIAWYS